MTRLASRTGTAGTLSVLLFHRVLAEADPLSPYEPTAAQFDDMLSWLGSQFTLLPLREAVRRLADGSLPPAAAAITFDDGYRDNLEVAAPILARHRAPATFFVATGFLDGGIMFNDVVIETLRQWPGEQIDLDEFGLARLPAATPEQRVAAISAVLKAVKHLPFDERREAIDRFARRNRRPLPGELMMTTDQLRRLAAIDGFDIGAHTHQHPILAKVDDGVSEAEMRSGRARLEAVLGRDVALFAYPNGRWIDDFDRRHRDMAQRCGFEAAFNTEAGVGTTQSDRWNLPRFTPWDRTAARFRTRMLLNQAKRPVFTDRPAVAPGPGVGSAP